MAHFDIFLVTWFEWGKLNIKYVPPGTIVNNTDSFSNRQFCICLSFSLSLFFIIRRVRMLNLFSFLACPLNFIAFRSNCITYLLIPKMIWVGDDARGLKEKWRIKISFMLKNVNFMLKDFLLRQVSLEKTRIMRKVRFLFNKIEICKLVSFLLSIYSNFGHLKKEAFQLVYINFLLNKTEKKKI